MGKYGIMIPSRDQKKNYLNIGKRKKCIVLIRPIVISHTRKARVEVDQWLG